MITKQEYKYKAIVAMLVFYGVSSPVSVLIFVLLGWDVSRAVAIMIVGSLFYAQGLWFGYRIAYDRRAKEASSE